MNTINHAYLIKVCNGLNGCPNAIPVEPGIEDDIRSVFKNSEIYEFMKRDIPGGLKIHHQIKITMSYCPNACSMPQIADAGIIVASPVRVSENPCSFCRACVKTCIENAIVIDPARGPLIDREKCLYCGKCAVICPMKTIVPDEPGFRVMLGGKLGRHPRLATELPGIHTRKNALKVMEKSLKLFTENYLKAKRFADLFSMYAKEILFTMLAP